MEPERFATLVARVRAGDAEAATEVVREFTPELRRYARFRLSDPTLRRFIDSLDICQSVLANFFVHISSGALALDDPQQLRTLLVTMAHNRILDHVRVQHADKRDARRVVSGDAALQAVVDPHDSPSRNAERNEILSAIRGFLSPEDKHLIDERLGGRDWPDLSNEFGGTPESLRKRMTRAIDQAARQLGLTHN